MTKYYIDANGNYIGGFDGAEPPAGSSEVTIPPENARCKWNGLSWIDDHNQSINEQILALEAANPISHRTMREFILGVSQVIAGLQGMTPAQLLDPKDPHYSHAFAAFADVNAKTIALRAQKT